MSDLNSDIEKYLHGTLTPAEMHLLEKRALNDPFLADALEGISSISAADFSDDVNHLHESLQKRTEKRSIPLWFWTTRIAASLLFLFIVGYVAFNLVDKNISKTELALNKAESQDAIQQPLIEPPSVQQPSITSENEFTVSPKDDSKDLHTPNTSKPKPTDNEKDKILSFNINSEESNVDETEKADVVNTWADDAKKMTADGLIKSQDKSVDIPSSVSGYIYQTKSDQPNLAPVSEIKENKSFKSETEDSNMKINSAPSLSVASRSKESKRELKVLQGKVIDDDGSPMPGVSVTLKDSSLGTVTDSEGNYKLTLDNDLSGELVFSFVGMQKTEIPIANSDSINAKLAPDFAELSEVVVVGYGSPDDDLTKEENINIYQPAAPDGGRKAYKNYLVENLKYPQQAIDDKVQGKVTVQFVIEADGRLNDFKILKGIGYGCDEEVIRLIKKGPKWNPTKRNEVPTKGKVKVKVKFSLPE